MFVVKNKGSKSTNGVAREPIKEMNPKTMEQREAEREIKNAVVAKQKVNKDTVPEKLLPTKKDEFKNSEIFSRDMGSWSATDFKNTGIEFTYNGKETIGMKDGLAETGYLQQAMADTIRTGLKDNKSTDDIVKVVKENASEGWELSQSAEATVRAYIESNKNTVNTADKFMDDGKVHKLSDAIKEVRLIESDKISSQEQQYYAELVDSLLGYSPDIKIQFNPSVASTVKDNTIIVGNTSTALEHIASVLLTKSTDELASTLTDVVYDESDSLSKLGIQLDSIRRDLKYAINDKRNGEYKLDIMMLLNEMTKDNGKLISIGLSNQRVMEFLKTIKTDRSKKDAKTNLFKRIVLAIGSYFNMNSNKSQNLFERLLEVGAKTAVTQNAVDSEYSYSKSDDALLPQLRGVTPEQAENERSKPFNERNLMVASFTQDQI